MTLKGQYSPKSLPTNILPRLAILVIYLSLFPSCPHIAYATSPATAEITQKKVLILNSYHAGYAWSDGEQAGILSVMQAKDVNWAPYIEYLDTKRYHARDYLPVIKATLVNKYSKMQFSLILAVDDPALEFAIDNQKKLFHDAPIVFCGINNYSPKLLKGSRNVTGVAENIDPAGTIEVMLKLHPRAREILVLHDYTISGMSLREEVEALIPRFSERIKIRFIEKLPMKDVLDQLEKLPEDALVLEQGLITDSAGQTFGFTETTELFTRHSPVPVYAAYSYRLGYGIVGGKLLDAKIHGAHAAQFALKVLAGTKAADIPIETKSDAQYMFDYKVMERFGIQLSALPPDSVVINKPVSFYAANRNVVLAIVAITIFLAVIIIILSFYTLRLQRMKRLLQESEVLKMAIMNTSPAGIVLLKNRELQWCNSTFENMSGYKIDSILGKNVRMFYADDDVFEKAGSLLYPQLEFGKSGFAEAESILKNKDGHTFSALIRLSKLDEYLTVAIVFDITDRKRIEEERRNLEERLQRAEKMEALGTLAGGVAHDLNNVLGVIVGYSELLLHETDKSSPILPRLTKIMNGSEKAAAIVQDLLTMARRGVPNRKVLNLNKIILDHQNSPELEKLFSHYSNVRIKLDLEPNLLNISGSSVHLNKTLFNLVSNSAEAMPKGGDLIIKTANQYLDEPIQGYEEVREGDYVVLSVTDTGEGIPVEDINRIFEPFYTKKVMGRSGTGLGLAVIWGTVKDHQGYINVQSEEGKGSTFILYFPVTREETSVEAASISISEYKGKCETILVVDDIRDQRDLATEMLKKLNYQVFSVTSGEDAVKYLKEHKVDLLVLDMIMYPGMDGLDTYKSVLQIRPKQKAIIVSGYSESDRVHTAQALGVGAYVKKPYVIEKLGMAVRNELDAK
jgi:PAS domain S-box-containing protein